MRSQGAPGVVVYRNPCAANGVDAIDAYSRCLVDALRQVGEPTAYADRGLTAVLTDTGPPPGWIVLQYNPFSYGTWGFAPALVGDVLKARRRWPRTPLVICVHEAWVSASDWRSAVMGAYQHTQLRCLLRLVDGVIVVRETLKRELGGTGVHIPVGSNIRPVAATRDEARMRLGFDDQIVVALFGRRNPSRALEHAEAAIAALALQHGTAGVSVLNLGSDSPIPRVPAGVALASPGTQPNDELSLHLRASDLLLLPFTDGLSTRRGTLMAGLAHALPVVGLTGLNTDRILVESRGALVLAPTSDVAAYARAVTQLTRDRTAMREIGDAAQSLYERSFDWPVLARMVLTVVFGRKNPRSIRPTSVVS